MSPTMTAAIVDRYGPPDVIRIDQVDRPRVGPAEVLVRVEAASVNSGDARMRSGSFPRGFALPARLAIGIRGPRRRVPGVVFAGRVEAVGDRVTDLEVGARVAGLTGARLGAHAEYVVVRESQAARVPDTVTSVDAAGALFGGSTARHFVLDRARVTAGQTVLVNGASGSVGTAAVQLAARAGAEVTAVSRSENHALVTRLGAATAVDYRTTPVAALPGTFDVVVDAVGNLNRSDGLRLAGDRGSLILAVASLGETVTARGRVIAGPAPERREHFAEILDLVAAGEFDPLVEVVGGLDALAEAHRRVDSGRKVGNLVVCPGE